MVGGLGLVAAKAAATTVRRKLAAKKKPPAVGKPFARRRRRKLLTAGAMTELTMIRNILGRTAAANALPFYLGRR